MKKIFKWIGIVLGSLVGLILITALTLFLIGSARLNKTYDFPPPTFLFPQMRQVLLAVSISPKLCVKVVMALT